LPRPARTSSAGGTPLHLVPRLLPYSELLAPGVSGAAEGRAGGNRLAAVELTLRKYNYLRRAYNVARNCSDDRGTDCMGCHQPGVRHGGYGVI
jgi:hypothetical protein